MKDKNRADEWTDDSKSRLFGFLKYRRNRKMKHDKQSKTRLRDIHIKNMKLYEEFVTQFSVDGNYKAWLDDTFTGLSSLHGVEYTIVRATIAPQDSEHWNTGI